MENQYKVIKDPQKLIEFLGLPKDQYLSEPIEPELEQALLAAKASQRSGTAP